jgi:hypothetical protein
MRTNPVVVRVNSLPIYADPGTLPCAKPEMKIFYLIRSTYSINSPDAYCHLRHLFSDTRRVSATSIASSALEPQKGLTA